MKVSFVIPSVNQYDMLFNDCIDSLVKFHGNEHEIIVVDDGSAPALQNRIEAECGRRNIRFLKNVKNSGFPITCNVGIRAATGDIIILVNNDVVFTQKVTNQFIDSFHIHPKIGVVGSLLFYPDGTIQHGGIVMQGIGGFTHRGWHKRIEQAPDVTKPGYLIAVTGALFAFKKECLDEIGLFNENYFLSCDDTEICVRAWMKDWRVFYNPDIKAIHAEGATRGKTDIEKQSKYRAWYMKEMETWGKFQKDLKNYDMGACMLKVNEYNAEFLGVKKPGVVGTEKMVFELDEAEKSEFVSTDKFKDRIVVRRTGALGDVLLATGVIRRLKQANPESQIVVSTLCGDIFNRNPHVFQVGRDVRVMSSDRFYDLDLTYEMYPKMPIWEAYSQKVFKEVVSDLQPELFSNEADYLSLISKLPNIDFGRDRVAVLHMAVSWSNRTWPRHRWMDISKKLSTMGYKVIVVGKGGDYRSDLYANITNMVDHLTIHEIRELCKRASVFVSVDSGLLHIAQTTSVPIVGLFTVANPKYRIIPRSSRTIALVPKSECRFCLHEKEPPVTYVECKYQTNHCLNDFQAADVLNAIKEISR